MQTFFDGQKGAIIIPEALLNDAGEYSVVASNEFGTTVSTCNVSVKGRIPNETSDSEFASDIEPIKPSVHMPLRDATVTETKSVRLDCIIVGQPEPEVIWYHNGQPVKESADVRLQFHGDRCSLLIHGALVEDGGDYRVVALNSAGETSSQCYLTVVKDVAEEVIIPMQFTKLLSDVLSREGERIELECSLVGKPNPVVTWLYNNKELPVDSRYQVSHDGQGNHKLCIVEVKPNDGGLYTVKATNPSGDVKSFSHVIVKAVNLSDNFEAKPVSANDENLRYICPTFKELFSDQFVTEGAATKFECIVIGKPVPKIKWLFNDQPVQGSQFLISTSGDRQVLAIPEVTLTVTGKVSCIAENEVGKATCVAYLNLTQPQRNGKQIADVESPETQTYTQEHNTQSSLVTITKQTFKTTQHQHVDSVDNNRSEMQIYYRDIPTPTMTADENRKVEEYRQVNDRQSNFNEKSVINVINVENLNNSMTSHSVAPVFVTALTGKIVDEHSDVLMEAIVDGYPTPNIEILKNGQRLSSSLDCSIVVDGKKVMISMPRVGLGAAGRFSCIASNPAGTATSVADLLVKSAYRIRYSWM